MPRTKKQYEEIRKNRIEIIEEAALKCFARYGYHQTSINRIAKEAKISSGLMYNYFESKQDLLKSIFLDGLKRIFHDKIAEIERLTPEIFRDFMNDSFDELANHVDYWKMYMMVMMQPDVMGDLEEDFMTIGQKYIVLLTHYFEERGSEQPLVDARMLLAVMDGVSLHYILDPTHFPLEQIKKKLIKEYTEPL